MENVTTLLLKLSVKHVPSHSTFHSFHVLSIFEIFLAFIANFIRISTPTTSAQANMRVDKGKKLCDLMWGFTILGGNYVDSFQISLSKE